MRTLVKKFNSKENAVRAINKHRLENKNSWYQFDIIINETKFKGKCFNTWIQLGEVIKENVSTPIYNNMDETPTQFKNYLLNTFSL